MAVLTKGLSFSNWSARNIVFSVLVFLLIVALFFLPELVGLQRILSTTQHTPRKISPVVEKSEGARTIALSDLEAPPVRPERTQSTPVSPATKPRVSAAAQEGSVPTQSAFDRFLALFRSRSAIDELRRRDSRAAVVTNSPRERAAVQPKNGSGKTLDWSDLHAPAIQAQFRKSYAAALELSSQIGPERSHSRFALFNFANGLRMIMRGDGKKMSALDAVSYLAHIDAQVGSALLSDRCDASIVNTWRLISLSRMLEDRAALMRGKAAAEGPFHPRVLVAAASLFQPTQSKTPSIPTVQVAISIRAPSISRVLLYHNGAFRSEYTPRQSRNRRGESGEFVIFLRGEDARGVYTVRVIDPAGQVFEKRYSFYERAVASGSTVLRGGRFSLPFSEKDPRLDQVFALNGGRLINQVSSGLATGLTDNNSVGGSQGYNTF